MLDKEFVDEDKDHLGDHDGDDNTVETESAVRVVQTLRAHCEEQDIDGANDEDHPLTS